MSDRWREKRRKDRYPWFDVFREFDRIEKMMDEMMRQAHSPFETSKKSRSFRPHVYGFSVTLSPDGRPRIRKFSNVQRSFYNPKINEQKEPLVDVLTEEEEVVVVAQLPGLEKDNINLHATTDQLTINVDIPQRKYRKNLPLPEKVDPKPVKASYKNGVLEVRFKKKKKIEKSARNV